MSASHASDLPSLWLRTAVAGVSLFVGLALAEAVVRLADDGAFGQLDLFAADPDAGMVLAAGARDVRAPGGGTYRVTIGEHGLRPTAGDGAIWLVLGDSQALGLGVDDDQTFTAIASGPTLHLLPVAVPGYGVGDALRRAEALLPVLSPHGVVVVVNQANDWDEAGRPVETRFTVAGGWLLPADAPTWARVFFASTLSRVHVLHHAVVALAGHRRADAPVWARDPAATEQATIAIRDAIRGFWMRHPELPLRVAYLPLDAATSAARAEASPYAAMLDGSAPDLAPALRAALPEHDVLDLSPALPDPASFLPGDYHLSPQGHAAVARLLHEDLARRAEEPPP